MKKIVLSVLIAGSLLATACKEVKKEATDLKNATVETANEAADATTDAAAKVVEGVKDAANAVVDSSNEKVNSALDGIKIPSFDNPEVTKHLKSYAIYANEYIAAKGDVLKNTKLAKEGVELAKKGKDLLATLDAEGSKKFKSVMNAIQSKMAPAK